MTSNNFRRSNVNAKTLQITDPGRSSFNLGHKNELSIPFGKIVPVNHQILLPSDTFQGSMKPTFHLEKIGTPSIGPTRLDTHTFIVNFRRINKDMRSNLENGLNFFPSFSLSKIMDHYLGALFTSTRNSYSSAKLTTVIQTILKKSNTTNFKLLVDNIWNELLLSLDEIINDTTTKEKKFEFGYQYDKLIYLHDYYFSCYSNWVSISQQNSSNENNLMYLYRYFLLPLYKPFFGESSLLDYLGYPVFTQYNQIFSSYSQIYSERGLTEDKYFSIFGDKYFDYFKNTLSNNLPADFLTFSFYIRYTVASQSIDVISLTFPDTFSELPLRAYYAVWYDYLRNWHIEERKNILDPDNFDNSNVFNATNVLPIFNTSKVIWLQQMYTFFQLFLLRSRDYNSDFLTTIQTDDVFRHVYSPVFNIQSGPDSNNFQQYHSGSELTPATLDGISIDLQGNLKDIVFPADTTRSSSSTDSATNNMAQDLQTMRRAGMLEKWLARNYYFPDTYVGRLQARFGVKPADYEILVSNYIGGSETFISGSELVANLSTSETVVGSRNLKADASTKDSFSGTVMDYSYLISVVSTVPIVSYDILHPATTTIDYVQFPQPEFATDTRVEARVSDFLRGFQIKPFIGYVPRYYLFRTAGDETHGRYLTDYRTFNWFRDAYSMSQEGNEFSLNPYSLRVRLPLDAFIGLKPWEDFAYGDCDCQLVVNRALPGAIEVI